VLHDPLLAEILGAAPLAYVCVTSGAGPMITPVLFTARDERLWMVVPRSSAKVAAIDRDASVGVTLVTDTAAAVFQGEGRVVDPLDPRTVLAALPDALCGPLAVVSYVRSNLGGLVDLIGPAALQPRVLVAVRPERYLVVGDLAARPALLGCESPSGPVALPARWDAATRTATVPAGLVAATGARTDGRLCLELDDRAEDKAGLALRGAATRVDSDGDDLTVVIDTDRITWWRGEETGTAARSAEAGAAV
jgi:hypothetical protein